MVAQTKTRLEETTDILIQGHKALQEHQCGTPTLEYLEGVAKVRHSLSVVAELLKSKQAGQAFENLLRAAEQLCSDRELNNFDSTGCRNILGPVVYFLKLLVRRYGMPFLKTTVERYEWIIPAELKSDNVIIKMSYVALFLKLISTFFTIGQIMGSVCDLQRLTCKSQKSCQWCYVWKRNRSACGIYKGVCIFKYYGHYSEVCNICNRI